MEKLLSLLLAVAGVPPTNADGTPFLRECV